MPIFNILALLRLNRRCRDNLALKRVQGPIALLRRRRRCRVNLALKRVQSLIARLQVTSTTPRNLIPFFALKRVQGSDRGG